MIRALFAVLATAVHACTIASPAGNCSGPIGRALASRAFYLSPQRAALCAANRVAFYADGSAQTGCGECLPGQHGNWRVHGNAIGSLPSNVQQCVTVPGLLGAQALQVARRRLVLNNFFDELHS